MKEVFEFLILLAWVGIISVAAIGIEWLIDRSGYRRAPPEPAGDHVPPLPESSAER
jgi:hypothetical protein